MKAHVMALLLLLVLLAGCASPRPGGELINLDRTVVLPENVLEQEQVPLKVAVAAMISPRETLVHYRALLDYIGTRLDRPIHLVQRTTYAEINELIRTGEVDLAFVCTWSYVRSKKEFGMELVAAPQVNGDSVYYAYLLVPAESAATDLIDLKGGVFAFTDPLSTTGRLVPTYWLAKMGYTPDQFFRKHIFTYSHDRAVLAVAEGLVDGAAVENLVYQAMVRQDPALADRVRVIRKSDPFGTPPAVVGPGMPGPVKLRIRAILEQMDQDPEGQRILQELQIDKWVTIADSAYDPIRRMHEIVEGH